MRIKTAMQDILPIFLKTDNDQNDFRILLMYFKQQSNLSNQSTQFFFILSIISLSYFNIDKYLRIGFF